MAHAYTPGLKVTEHLLVKKQRILPLKGEVVVKVGDRVKPDDVIARTELPGNVEPLNVANKIGVPPEDLEMLMLKKEGDQIKKGEPIALKKSFIKWFNSSCEATVDGTLESISSITGQVLQRGLPIPVEVKAYLVGKVTDIFPKEGVEVTCVGAFVQGIFGICGETSGKIKVVVPDKNTILEEKYITDDLAGMVIVGGSLVTADAVKKAIKVGVNGIVSGGLDDKDLRDFLGYDIGVAITGSENFGCTLVITEGFGQISMAGGTFDLLKSNEGKLACINGATQIRAGVIRPEVVIPLDDETALDAINKQSAVGGLKIGSPVRVIRHPYFGHLGHVIGLPSPLTKLESESVARVLEVEFENGEKAIIPRANVEMIES
ncbi:MAG: hypothetical protein DRP47_10420 [Candidatus Zixiibacteriota bacterium]|nr:MAG: hypothetical protein DRP47_10420 [candidate division Zixibacteria bacterium]